MLKDISIKQIKSSYYSINELLELGKQGKLCKNVYISEKTKGNFIEVTTRGEMNVINTNNIEPYIDLNVKRKVVVKLKENLNNKTILHNVIVRYRMYTGDFNFKVTKLVNESSVEDILNQFSNKKENKIEEISILDGDTYQSINILKEEV